MSIVMWRTLAGSGAGLTVWLFTLALTHRRRAYRLGRLNSLLAFMPDERPRAEPQVEVVQAPPVATPPFHRRVLWPLWERLSSTMLRYAPARITATLQRQLDAAGNPRNVAPHDWLLVKTASMIVFLSLGAASTGIVVGDDAVRAALYVVVSAAVGFQAPHLWLYRRRRRHLEGIRRALPDVVDLLRISMEGGLSYDSAVNYVVAKMKNPLTYEMARYLLDRQVGRGQGDAMRLMGQRTRQADLLNMVEVVAQGELLGTGINRALQGFSSDLRTKRRQRAERKAHEAALKMLFPMMLLIFPAIFIIILGPTVPIFMRSFGL